MNIEIKHYGKTRNAPSKIIQLKIVSGDATIYEDITDLNYNVDPNLIENLRLILEELEEQNELIRMKKNIIDLQG